MDDPRRRVPRTDAVLADPLLAAPLARLGRDVVKTAVLAAQARARAGEIGPSDVVAVAAAALPGLATSLRPVLNATGVVLHTNLGRAPLSVGATQAMVFAAGYTDVELDLATGARGRRGRGTLAALLAAVPDAQDALVVNNGAAALALAATALTATSPGAGRELLVSRGELVEIGDGFRLPDLLQSTGAHITEVGTTNRTTLADYADAVGPETAAIVKIHPSNFRVEGFTSAVDVAELATLGPPVVADIGSGLLAPDPLLPDEPDACSSLRAGAHLVTASADKLLGGPQAGLVLGRAHLVERLRRHPLARGLRVDKLTLAALEATLRGPVTPTWQALRAGPARLLARCEAVVADLAAGGVAAAVVPSDGAVGGGGAPGLVLPGWAVGLPERYGAALRAGAPAVVGRMARGRLLLDLRCVPPERDADIVTAVLAVPAPS